MTSQSDGETAVGWQTLALAQLCCVDWLRERSSGSRHLRRLRAVLQKATQQRTLPPGKQVQQLCDQLQQSAILAVLRGHRHVEALQQSSLELLSRTLPALEQHSRCLQELLAALTAHCTKLAQAAGKDAALLQYALLLDAAVSCFETDLQLVDKVLPALQLDVDLDELDYYILMWRLQPYTHRGLFEQLLHSEQMQDQETQQLLLELDCAG